MGVSNPGKNLENNIHTYAVADLTKEDHSYNILPQNNIVYIGPDFLAKKFFKTINKENEGIFKKSPYRYPGSDRKLFHLADNSEEEISISFRGRKGSRQYYHYIIAADFRGYTQFVPFTKEYNPAELSNILKEIEGIEKINKQFCFDHLNDIGFILDEKFLEEFSKAHKDEPKEEPQEEDEEDMELE